jgi:hypothetical protein
VHLIAEGHYTRRLVEFVESSHSQGIPPVHLFYADGRIGGKVGDGPFIGSLELLPERLEFRLRGVPSS